MGFMFATCDKKRALGFINSMYPELDIIVEDDIPLLMDLIGRDILRVQDPDFHKPSQIVSGNNYSAEYDAEIQEAIEELKKIVR